MTLSVKGNNGNFRATVLGLEMVVRASSTVPINRDPEIPLNGVRAETRDEVGDAEWTTLPGCDEGDQQSLDELDWQVEGEEVDIRLCPTCDVDVIPNEDGRCPKCGGVIA